MKLKTLLDILEKIAPLSYAESWDNVGLIVGESGQSVSRVMLTIDYTEAVAQEAKSQNVDAVIAYHPPIFEGLKKVTDDRTSRLVYDALRRGVALYSPHTALDVTEGGTNDVLADLLVMRDRRPLRVSAGQPMLCKLITFVPEHAIERVSTALFNAGAGHIGRYSSCSFRMSGTGTFLGEEGTNPAVGEAGKLTVAPETRIETILPISEVEAVVAALKKSHPYEEPAFDLSQLLAMPEGRGIGRVGAIPDGATVEMLVNKLKRDLNINHVLLAGPTDRVVSRAAVCAGSCGNLLDEAIKARVDLYVTGEMRHHDVLKAVQAGLSVVALLHSNSERAVLPMLKEMIEAGLPNLPIFISQSDRDPFSVM